MRGSIKQTITFILVTLLAACGGGSGGSNSTTSVSTPKTKSSDDTQKKTSSTVRQELLSYNIESASDDAIENTGTGSVSLNDTKITLGSDNLVGFRFSGIEIPKNAAISSAYLQLSAHKELASKTGTRLQIQIEDSVNSSTFTSQIQSLSRRNKLPKSVEWDAGKQWSVINERGSNQRTPELADLLQTIIDKNDWKPGNSISVFLQGQGLQNINSYEESNKLLDVNDLSATLVIKLSKLDTFRPNSKHDDAEENLKTGFIKIDDSDLELGWEAESEDSAQRVGIRFTNVNITPKSKIHKAYIQFTQDESKNANPFEASIYGENTGNAKAFSIRNKDLSNRSLTNKKATWSSTEKWIKLHESSELQRTTDIAPLVQEIVNNPQWKTGNAMAFLIDGKGTRTAEPFESGPELAPKLVVEYTNASTPLVFDKIRLTWRDDPTSTMSIIWNQNEGNDGVVYYDEYTGTCPKDPAQYTLSQSKHRHTNDYDMRNVTTRLTNLKPDTSYRFIIKNDNAVSACSWFKTAPNTPKPFSYISGGDTKSSGSALTVGRWSDQMVSKVRPLFVLFTGDFNSGIGWSASSWQQWLTDWSTLTRSKDGRMYPLIAVHGNHENGDSNVLYKLFDTGNSNKNENNNIAYNEYSFGGNLLHLVSLNSELPKMFLFDEDSRQTAWLKNVLEQHQNHQLKVFGYHKPMRPHTRSKSEATRLSSNWAPLMEQYGVHVAYESDTHNHVFTYPIRLAKQGENGELDFIRDDIKGTMHVGEGSWGASPRKTDDNKSWTLESQPFNQIKLNRVYPATNTAPARLEISVIKIADRNEQGKLVNYIEGVREANDNTPTTPPKGVTLHNTPGFGKTVSVPFKSTP